MSIRLSVSIVLSVWALAAAPVAAQSAGSGDPPRCRAHAEDAPPGKVGSSRCVAAPSSCGESGLTPVASGKPPGPCKCACKPAAEKKPDAPKAPGAGR